MVWCIWYEFDGHGSLIVLIEEAASLAAMSTPGQQWLKMSLFYTELMNNALRCIVFFGLLKKLYLLELHNRLYYKIIVAILI